ncbi:MAG TPA: CRTAC1 family protein [Pirellulales bacterium]|nr:CRTAC1 family protein [Pirellulales bacterium]
MGLPAAMTLVLAGFAIALTAWRHVSPRHLGGPGDDAGSPGFREAAVSSGIDFRMSFLPNEQGEHFKINLYDHGAGVVVGDYDGDGHDDILLLNQLGSNGLYRNLGDGRFVEVTAMNPAVALGDRVCVGGTFADYDNDGDQDLYITSTRGGNVLLENRGAEGFRDVSERAGVACTAHSQTAAFFDYDNDGYLDLLVTNTARWTSNDYDGGMRYYVGPELPDQFVRGVDDFESNFLFRNNRDGTFTDVAAEAGAQGQGWSGDVAVFDYDGDCDLDLFIANMFGCSQLLNNDGRGRFTDATSEALGPTSFGTIGCKVFDYDSDGRLDLFVADMHSDMWMDYDDEGLIEPRRKYRYLMGRKATTGAAGWQKEKLAAEVFNMDYGRLLFGNTLYRNEGGGSFSEVSDDANMETFWPWGVACGDFDADGHEDVYIPSGMGYPFFYHPSYLMMSQGDGTFRNEDVRQGIEPPGEGKFLPPLGGKQVARSSRCAATADFDGDGRLDLIVNNFNDRPYYFRNQFPKANFVEFRLTGTRSNRDAIGAVVTLRCGQRTLVRQVQCAGGYLSQSSKTLHFGLGELARVDRAEIRWPSGTVQRLDVGEINRLYEIREEAGPGESTAARSASVGRYGRL